MFHTFELHFSSAEPELEKSEEKKSMIGHKNIVELQYVISHHIVIQRCRNCTYCVLKVEFC